MAIIPSLSRFTNWAKALGAVGHAPDVAVLPYRRPCLLCGGPGFTVYHDAQLGGAWFNCESCLASGDTVELVMKYRGLTAAAAVYLLLGAGALVSNRYHVIGDELVARYVKFTIGNRLRLRELWAGVSSTAPSQFTRTAADMQRRLGLDVGLSDDRWRAGLGRLVGASDRKRVEMCFFATEAGAVSSGDRVFTGGGWGDVLVIPFWDLPGRVRGFLIAGRDLDPSAGDVFYRGASLVERDASTGTDAGVALWPAVSGRRPSLGDAVFVLPDPVLALRMHAWHIQDHDDVLPLVATWKDARWGTSPHVWGPLTAGALVFWGPPSSRTATYVNARAAGGRVVTAPWPARPTEEFARRGLPEVLASMLSGSLPWREALARDLRDLPRHEGDSLLYELRLPPEELLQFLGDEAPDLSARFRPPPGRVPTRVAWYDGETLTETDEGWFVDLARKKAGPVRRYRISDTVLRIDTVVYGDRPSDVFYEGSIVRGGREATFTAKAADVDDTKKGWLGSAALKAGLGLPQVRSTWRNRVIEVATTFRVPAVRRAATRLGWSPDDSSFVFRDFVVTATGDVRPARTIVADPSRAPAAGLSRPAELTGGDLEALSSGPAGAAALRLAAVVAHNLLCPVFGERPGCVVLLADDNPAGHVQLLRLLGCSVARGTAHCAVMGRHGWPVVLLRDRSRLAPGENVVVPARPHRAHALGLSGDYHMVRATAAVAVGGPLSAAVAKVIPSFLRFTAVARFAIDRSGGLGAGVSLALAEWFAGQGGDAAVVAGAVARIDWASSDPARNGGRVLALLRQLHGRGRLRAVEQRAGGVFLPQNVFRIVRTHPPVPAAVITDGLRAVGALVRPAASGEAPGWLLTQAAWDGVSRAAGKRHKH